MNKKKKCKIIWFTGVSGVGKSTICNQLYKQTKKKYKIKIIDGDVFRKKFNNDKKFSIKSIEKNNKLIIKYIDKIRSKFDYVYVAVIAPLKKTRFLARTIFKKNYFEIFLTCNLRTLISRDPKGLYKKAIDGNLKNLIGYSSRVKYEKSKHKKIIFDTSKLTVKNILKKITKNKLIYN